MEFTLSLALVDFLPVAFTAIGLMFVVRMISLMSRAHGQAATIGAVLTIAGGFFRALWKLLMAVSDGAVDINWMENGLFIWMAPGYTLLAWSVWQAVRHVHNKPMLKAWFVPGVLILIMISSAIYLYASDPSSPAWERVLLSVLVLATVVTSILLITLSFKQNLPLAGWLFIVNLIGVFLLNGLARIADQTIAVHWAAESINLVSWLCFAIAAARVFDHLRTRFGTH